MDGKLNVFDPLPPVSGGIRVRAYSPTGKYPAEYMYPIDFESAPSPQLGQDPAYLIVCELCGNG